MSLRFLRREAKLCSFLQKSFLALEQRMKASEGWRVALESSLREELDSRWQKLEELDRQRQQALQGRSEEEQRDLVSQCQDLDKAVIRLTTFVQQNQVSLNRILVAQQKTRDVEGALEESQAEEVAACLQEGLETLRQAGQLAQRETQQELELFREKSQALETSVTELVRQVQDLGDHFLALSWKLDLQGRTLDLRLSEARNKWEDMEHRSKEELARCRQEAEAQLKAMQEMLWSLPQQIETISDKCILHKSDSDLKISEEGRARDQALGALRQELAALLASVQLLKEANPTRKMAEMQGKLATFQNQIMKLENSMQDHRAIQNLKFNTETKLRMEEMAALRDGVARLWSGGEPWALAQGRRKAPHILARHQLFIKHGGSQELFPVNCWGVYQAVRWLQWKSALLGLLTRRRFRATMKMPLGWKPAYRLASLP